MALGRRLGRLLALGALLLALAPTSVGAQAACTFQLGFKAIADQIPEIVGRCLENEWFNTTNGNAEQRTTAHHGQGGLLVWRKEDNWTAFTDGHWTWVNGPFGLQRRLNSERFAWEGPERLSWPERSVTRDEAAQLARAEAARVLGVAPERLSPERVEAVEWRDASLGCAQPDRFYAAVIVPGHRVVLTLDGRAVHVHAGSGTAVLCPRPTQPPLSS